VAVPINQSINQLYFIVVNRSQIWLSDKRSKRRHIKVSQS
jgi:hypothetical protein